MHTVWAWTSAAVCFSAAAVVRAYAYRIRERGRRKTITAVLQHLDQQGGFAHSVDHSVDRDGRSWTMRASRAQQPECPADGRVQRVRNAGHVE
ncbi:hypothetical protein GCM10010277_78370 [Streptomyces longisporoflavus]|nr:hypothetical protein GCM10010277_78370 [Streptomyces longisporoflavus]